MLPKSHKQAGHPHTPTHELSHRAFGKHSPALWMMLSGSVWRVIVSTCGPYSSCQRQQKQTLSQVCSSSSAPHLLNHLSDFLSLRSPPLCCPYSFTLLLIFSLSLTSIQHNSIIFSPSFLLLHCSPCFNAVLCYWSGEFK